MVSDGLSEVIGSWKIIEICRPRIFSISRSLFLSRSWPSKRISPLTISPGGDGIKRRIDSEVTLLPQPVSPTMPKVSLADREKERSRTAASVPRRRLKLIDKFLTSSKGVAIPVKILCTTKDTKSTKFGVLIFRTLRDLRGENILSYYVAAPS